MFEPRGPHRRERLGVERDRTIKPADLRANRRRHRTNIQLRRNRHRTPRLPRTPAQRTTPRQRYAIGTGRSAPLHRPLRLPRGVLFRRLFRGFHVPTPRTTSLCGRCRTATSAGVGVSSLRCLDRCPLGASLLRLGAFRCPRPLDRRSCLGLDRFLRNHAALRSRRPLPFRCLRSPTLLAGASANLTRPTAPAPLNHAQDTRTGHEARLLASTPTHVDHRTVHARHDAGPWPRLR
jgi:hypothetical protein